MTQLNDVLARIRNACDHCANGVPAVSHLGGREWIHSTVNRGQHTVTLCKASAIRVEHQDVLRNG